MKRCLFCYRVNSGFGCTRIRVVCCVRIPQGALEIFKQVITVKMSRAASFSLRRCAPENVFNFFL